jgi:hypothetical protein
MQCDSTLLLRELVPNEPVADYATLTFSLPLLAHTTSRKNLWVSSDSIYVRLRRYHSWRESSHIPAA